MESVSKPLVCEGGTLMELRFVGNGKDSEVTIRTVEHPEVLVPLSGAEWDVRSTIPLSTEMRAFGDTSVEFIMRPADSLGATLSEARVDDYSGDPALPTITKGSRVEVELCVVLYLVLSRLQT